MSNALLYVLVKRFLKFTIRKLKDHEAQTDKQTADYIALCEV